MRTLSLVLTLLFFPVFAHGDIPDISNLSHDELLALNQSVQDKLFLDAAAVDGAVVPPGIYTVGVDLPSGTYRIRLQTPSLIVTSITAVNEPEWFGYTSIMNSNNPEIGKLTLTDNTILTISGGVMLFFTYKGLF